MTQYTENLGSQSSLVSIQLAINEADTGSTILVPSGTYYEHVIVNKTVNLYGEKLASVIDGTGNGTVFEIISSNVVVAGFRIQNSGYGWDKNGFYVHNADNVTVERNYLNNTCHNIKVGFSKGTIIRENTISGIMTSPTMYGIRIENSSYCSVSGNNVSDCVAAIHFQNATFCSATGNNIFGNDQGIRLYSPCTFNEFYENDVNNCTYDGMIDQMPQNMTMFGNAFYHNNFVNNRNPFIYATAGTKWDQGYPSGGNYWSRHNAFDEHCGQYQNETGKDGISDSNYAVSRNSHDVDNYPLMHPYGSVWNLDTNLTYLTISSAINAEQTANGNRIFIKSGNYPERLVINKSLSIVGENRNTTMINAEGVGTAVTVTSDDVIADELTLSNSGTGSMPYDCGLFLDHCSRSRITHLRVTNCTIGIYCYYAAGSIVTDNTVWSNREYGIRLWHSSNSTLTRNQIFDNPNNFGVSGESFTEFDNRIDETNTVDGEFIKYLVNARDLNVDNDGNIGCIYLINCTNVQVGNVEVEHNEYGILVFGTYSALVSNVTASENFYGIFVSQSTNIVLDRNHCMNNFVGICLSNANSNMVVSNHISGGEKSISLYEADQNIIEANNLTAAIYGIRLFDSSTNKIVHNNLCDNSVQASILAMSFGNSWDNGFEGNFWSDYNGFDQNYDGVGDSAYVLDESNADAYPLLGLFFNRIINGNDGTYAVEVTTNSTLISVDFLSSNRTLRICIMGPDGTAGFCRIAIPRALIASPFQVTLDNGDSEILYCNYTLRNDDQRSWIYISYYHSTHLLTILPEYSLLSTLIFMSGLLSSVAYGRYQRAKNLRLK